MCLNSAKPQSFWGSIAGLMAARVLADYYTTVTVVERDVLPERPVARRGVPHGPSPHIPQVRATQTMEELFPGSSMSWWRWERECGRTVTYRESGCRSLGTNFCNPAPSRIPRR